MTIDLISLGGSKSKTPLWALPFLLLLVVVPKGEGIVPVVRDMKPFWNSNEFPHDARSKNQQWADAAWDFVRHMDCEHVTFTSTKECQRLLQMPKEAVSIHTAPMSTYGRYNVIVPDGRLTRGHLVDAVLVLDPFPDFSYGHVLLVFFIEANMSRFQCQNKDGVYIDNGECMYLALRRRCRNAMARRTRRRNFAKRCEINFLPVTHLANERSLRKTNHLRCQSGLRGFHACPQLRPANETSALLCNPILENSQTCSTTHATIRTSCRAFEICDQAVILSGGWNRETSDVTARDNVVGAYRLLRLNGFKRRNIKVFYSNGVKEFKVSDELPLTAHSSAMKLAFRYHLQRMCASPHCVDSLVLYLNSPTMHDGTMLLWDVNENGKAEEGEKYSIDELLEDLADCSAKQIQIFVDSSYSGELAHAFKNSLRHRKAVVLASGKGYEYSYKGEFTKYWTAQNDTRMCTTEAHTKSHKVIQESSPVISNPGSVQATLSGAACDVKPPYSNRELKRDFFGCQNLPTAVWLREILQHSNSNDISLNNIR